MRWTRTVTAILMAGAATLLLTSAPGAAGKRAKAAVPSVQAIQDGPDIQPPKVINEFLIRGEGLMICPSSSKLCMACYRHAQLTGCADCDYLISAERLGDGSIRCTWATMPFLKTQR